MATQGPNSPASGSYTNSGDDAILNPSNCVSSNNSYATGTPFASFISVGLLVASDFGFSIPNGSTIDGVTVEIEGYRPLAAASEWDVVIVGSNVASQQRFATVPASEGYVTLGGSSDTWALGANLTWDSVNASNFAVRIRGVNNDGSTETFYIDHIRLTVSYTLPPASQPGRSKMQQLLVR